jgi:hypothetical protein
VLSNTSEEEMTVRFQIKDTPHDSFQAFRTTGDDVYEHTETARYKDDQDNFTSVGTFTKDGDSIIYLAPANSVTTFLGL